jgi:hypothetical protein
MLRRPASLGALTVLAALAGPSPAQAAELLDQRLSTPAAAKRVCHDRLATGAGVVQRRVTLPAASLVRARLNGGRGDWDLGLFDATTRRAIGGSAGFGTAELAETFHPAGEVVVQACRRTGAGGSPRLQVAHYALPAANGERTVSKLVRVSTPTRAHKTRLQALGLDLTEHGHHGTLEAVLHGPEDEARLRAAGFDYAVQIPDLLARDLENKRADLAYSLRTARSALPSGRDEYRRLADFDAEMKQLAEAHPNLVKPLTMPHRSLEGRQINGIEITENARQPDGKPVFLQMGVHHAREWPSGEMPMEFAHDLVNGFGKDARTTRLVRAVRTIVVPIVNPDGYNLSREASVDLRVTGTADPLIQPLTTGTIVDSSLNNSPGHIVAILADGQIGQFAYKRRNCRIKDGETPPEGACGQRENRSLGTDPNRNYGGFWGGPGASHSPSVDTYRGAAPFSEPEVQNVRELVSTRQVTTLITNHTYSDLVLRPPGLQSQGPPPDEPVYKALGDDMAAQNGYDSQKSYELYDTTGTTEDWTYYATGGLGFTFEIGNSEFHPPYERVVEEYTGKGGFAGRGNREAYFIALESAANTARHSVIQGRAKPGTELALSKSFTTWTSPVLANSSNPATAGDAIGFTDSLVTKLTVPASGVVDWHVNPSTRPAVRGSFVPNIADAPARRETGSAPQPTVAGTGARTPLTSVDVPFTVGENDAREAVRLRVDWASTDDDYDIEIYRKQGTGFAQVGKSWTTGGSSNFEEVLLPNPLVGEYVIRVVNWAAVDPAWTWSVEYYEPGPNQATTRTTESWELRCPDGRTSKVVVERGQRFDGGVLCATGEDTAAAEPTVVLSGVVPPAARDRQGGAQGGQGGAQNGQGSQGSQGGTTAPAGLRYTVVLHREKLATALRRGLRTRVGCTAACRVTVELRVDRATQRRLRLRSARVGTATVRRTAAGGQVVRVRFTREARSKLRRARNVRLAVRTVVRDARGRTATARRTLTLRR